MGIEDLTQLEIMQGILSLTYLIIGIIVGVYVCLKYITYHRKEHIGLGLAIIFSVIPWMASGISFLTYIFFDYLLDPAIYLFISYGSLGFAIAAMVYAIMSLTYPGSVNKITLIYLTIAIIFDIIMIYFLIINVSLVGEITGKFDSEATRGVLLYIIFILISSIIFRIILIRTLSRSERKDMRWRGRFIIIEVILMVIGSLMDAAVTLSLTTLIIARILLVIRLGFLYLGWLLPKRISKWLIGQKEQI